MHNYLKTPKTMILSKNKKLFNYKNKNKIKFIRAKINYFLNKQFIPNIFYSINVENTNVCNLKCKFCAYSKRDFEKIPHLSMEYNFFKDIIFQILELGYKQIGLTPQTGEIFMDKKIFEKFELLESLSELDGYFFYTNFIPLNKFQLEKILKYKKLKNFGISIYGHDEKSFIKFSNGTINSYKKIVNNLNYLYEFIQNTKINFNIEIAQRTEKNFLITNNESDLSLIIKKLLNLKKIFYSKNHSFNNWGGYIKEEDIKDLDIKFEKDKITKVGACSLIFSRLLIGANGIVNACACRDVDFSLSIGDLKEKKLSSIISLNNPTYKELIEKQEKNIFPEVCNSCDFYKSIYEPNNHKSWNKKNQLKVNYQNLESVNRILEKRK